MQHAIIVIHGTWGKSPDGFYQYSTEPGSFCQKLLNRLSESIPEEDIRWYPMEWEDGNSHNDRVEGARSLAKLLRSLNTGEKPCRIHIIGHSHGGNVALKGIEFYLSGIQSDFRSRLDGADAGERATKAMETFAALANSDSSHGEALRQTLTELQSESALKSQDPVDAAKALRRTLTERRSEDPAGPRDSADTAKNRPRSRSERYSARATRIRAEEKLLARSIELASINPEVHRIDSVVTLGTPFFFKRWQQSKASRGALAAVRGTINAFYGAIGFYTMAMVIGGIIALLPPAFIGFNPLEWPPWIQVFGLLIIAVIVIGSIIEEGSKNRNTNVYFDAAGVASTIDGLSESKICRVLNVHAGLLDEPYLGMAVFPTLNPFIRKKIQEFTTPKAWVYVPAERRVGVAVADGAGQLLRSLWSAFKFLLAVIWLMVYPVRKLWHYVASWLLKRSATKRLRVLAYGIRPVEHLESRITVHHRLQQDYFDHGDYNAAEHVSRLKINTSDEAERYEFLTDDVMAEARFRDSSLRKHLGDDFDMDEKRKLLALEERVREFWGVSGVRHSMYYDNDEVIARIAAFVLDSVVPAK